jgi:hypothetical protein
MAAWPALKEVRSYLRMEVNPTEDAVIQAALDAAIDYGVNVLGTQLVDNGDGTFGPATEPIYPSTTQTLPDACHYACLQHAGKLYRRRDSLDGTLGVTDGGVVRVSGRDPDIDRGYALYAPLVFG